MTRLVLALMSMIASAAPALADEVKSFAFYANWHGVRCTTLIQTEADVVVSGIYSETLGRRDLSFSVTGLDERLIGYIDTEDGWDEAAFAAAFPDLQFGEAVFAADDHSIVSGRSDGVVSRIEPFFNVSDADKLAVARAMSADLFAIPGLVSIEGMAEAFEPFRTCLLREFDPEDPEAWAAERRGEYAAAFQTRFEEWATHAGIVVACHPETDIEAMVSVLDRAAFAFHPGPSAVGARAAFVADRTAEAEARLSLPDLETTEEACNAAQVMGGFALRRIVRTIEAAEALR